MLVCYTQWFIENREQGINVWRVECTYLNKYTSLEVLLRSWKVVGALSKINQPLKENKLMYWYSTLYVPSLTCCIYRHTELKRSIFVGNLSGNQFHEM